MVLVVLEAVGDAKVGEVLGRELLQQRQVGPKEAAQQRRSAAVAKRNKLLGQLCARK